MVYAYGWNVFRVVVRKITNETICEKNLISPDILLGKKLLGMTSLRCYHQLVNGGQTLNPPSFSVVQLGCMT